ncbi:MAG: aldo/keto reductase [Planctomycetota bacterium]|jgi:predicted aldo/keto reductase-like oxidoreductase
MKEKHRNIDRRNFLKTVCATGLGSVIGSVKATAGSNDATISAEPEKPKLPQVPRRKLGKTGVEVPCLSLGSGAPEDPAMLRKALEWGVNCWDTSYVAAGGNSELGIGRYISKNPDVRKKLFIVTKESDSKTPADLEKCLKTSLERMNTSYVDLYIGVYIMSDPAKLTDELRQWVKSAKERKLIRFFGFSTHKNTAKCLAAAAKLDWIDAILTAYNFRLMQDAEMQAAVEACHKAGIGLIAIKTQGMGQKFKTEADKKLVEHFLKRGFTEGQAKIKAVLEDKRISSACVAMNNVALLISNIAAVLDKTNLAQADMEVFKEHAQATCSNYCAGCAYICDSALPAAPYVSDIMRYLMYYNSYGEYDKARELFAHIPSDVRKKLLSVDYSLAEARCPQHLPISRLVSEAVSKLA